MSVTEQDVMKALSAIEDPDLHRDIVSLGFVQTPEIDGDTVSVRIILTTPACPVRERSSATRSALLLALPGVREANVTHGSERRAASRVRAHSRSRACATSSPSPATRAASASRRSSSNLAVALASLGRAGRAARR